MSDYETIARFYDLDYQDRRDDIDMYLGFALRCGSPILEIGVGTGRIAIPLALAGYGVTGVDISPAMLKLARDKSQVTGIGQRIDLVQSDARCLDLGKCYNLAIIAASSFMHFVNMDEQTAVLRSVRDHLQPGGLLIIDVINPDQYISQDPDRVMIHEYTKQDPGSGCLVTKFQVKQTDQARQELIMQFLYDEIAGDGVLRRTVVPFRVRYFTQHELYLLLVSSGFRVEHIYGSYELDEYSSESPSMIFVAARVDD